MRSRLRLVVDNGRVACPVRGRSIDLEECLSCFSFQGREKAGEAVVCKVELADVALARTTLRPPASVWWG